jgi:hypothetical protein
MSKRRVNLREVGSNIVKGFKVAVDWTIKKFGLPNVISFLLTLVVSIPVMIWMGFGTTLMYFLGVLVGAIIWSSEWEFTEKTEYEEEN